MEPYLGSAIVTMNYNEPLKIGIEITLGIIAHHGQLRAECFVGSDTIFDKAIGYPPILCSLEFRNLQNKTV